VPAVAAKGKGKVELGILSLSDVQTDPASGRPVPAGRRLDEIVGYATLADRLGPRVFGLGEHHTLDFAVSSPAVALAAVAGRTSRIRLTSAVTVLPVLDPVRVYQDDATLDLISHGRAEVTVGRSAFTEPFAIFGERLQDYEALFSEKLDLLLRLRENDHVTWSGRFRPPLDAGPIAPRAQQHPLSVWADVGGSRQSAERAGHPEKLRVGISSHFFAGATAARRRPVDAASWSTGRSSRRVPGAGRPSWSAPPRS
jgi:alkanesulfonate monooxygenase SsuD/methylene tetrahydromethanopterin reductase-like flavin-dependent oxidoreductase (luciferase family)